MNNDTYQDKKPHEESDTQIVEIQPDQKENGKQEPAVVKRNGKATVFTRLFSEPKYLQRLYKTIHPEQNVALEEFKNITTEAILTNTIYNDLGFSVRDQLIVMMEAQSTWSVNISYRELEYLVHTWKEYISETEQNRYSTKKMQLPLPEVYLLFSGERKEKPEYISFAKVFFPNQNCPIDLKIKVIYYDDKSNILNEYIGFTRIFDECVRKYKRSEEAVREILRICREEGYLVEFLAEHEKEVAATLFDLFDHERIQRDYQRELRKDIREEVWDEVKEEVRDEYEAKIDALKAQIADLNAKIARTSI
ncbi:MAG: hypothetical protein Q4A32_08305 [Lachnospiraceae bacterium]|nr:hypothetical protein [Lachnospiraceae bacterium]